MNTKHCLAIFFCAAMVSVAHAQTIPSTQEPVVVEGPQIVIDVPAPVVRVPPVVVEQAEEPAYEEPESRSFQPRTQPRTFQPRVYQPRALQPRTFQPQPQPRALLPRLFRSTPRSYGSAGGQPTAQIPTPVGSVLASRWFDERLNTSPGKTNHTAIYAGDGIVVESQAGIGVQEVSWSEYEARPQHVDVVAPPTPEFGQAAAARARALVGLPYFKLSSITLFKRPLQRGLNCVSVAEEAWQVPLRWPDDIYSAYPGLSVGPLERGQQPASTSIARR